MRNTLVLSTVLFAGSCVSSLQTPPMKNDIFSVSVECQRDGDSCLFDGGDMFIGIKVENTSSSAIGFPLDFTKMRGPVVRLVDHKSGASTYLKTNPVDTDLLGKFVVINPQQSVEFPWVIKSAEIAQFNQNKVALLAIVTVNAHVEVAGDIVEFASSDEFDIVGVDVR